MEGKGKKLAIITARGGSKRIPKKNIRPFLGKPIIAYSIEAALESKLFDEVMVSTDSEEIAEIAKKYGANVPFMRSEQTASDFATTADVLLEVISEYKKRGQEYEYMACLYPTAPFVTGEKLQEAFRVFKKSDAVELKPVVPFSYPPQRGFVIRNDYLEMQWKEHLNTRSQELEKIYHDCGQFYFYRVAMYIERKGQIPDGIIPFVIDELEVQDIDNETDWQLAELKYQFLKERKGK